LTGKNTPYCRYGVFKVRVSEVLTEIPETGLSKLNSVTALRAVSRSTFLVPGEPERSDGSRPSTMLGR
jgi:hypothetical protein